MDVINDDSLRLILERIDSPVDLIRAASICRLWRRTIADGIFLRRFRSLHACTVADDYFNNSLTRTGKGGGPLFVPSSSFATHHFSLDFLPDGASAWSVVDSRGSLLLVDHARLWNSPYCFLDMAVCETLTRRYVRIPPQPGFNRFSCHFFGSYLVDGNGNEAGSRILMSNFRVLCGLQRVRAEELYSGHSGVLACAAVFTVAGAAGSSSWTETAIDCQIPLRQLVMAVPGAHGTSTSRAGHVLIVLDGSTGVFSSSVLPATEDWDSNMWSRNFYVTDSCDGEPRIVTVFDDTVRVFARLDDGEWAVEKRILLQEATRCLSAGYQVCSFRQSYHIVSRGTGFVILSPRVTDRLRFSIDLETMEVAPIEEDMGAMAHQCELPWPPALHAGLD